MYIYFLICSEDRECPPYPPSLGKVGKAYARMDAVFSPVRHGHRCKLTPSAPDFRLHGEGVTGGGLTGEAEMLPYANPHPRGDNTRTP